MGLLTKDEIIKALNDDLETGEALKRSNSRKANGIQAPDARYSWRDVAERNRRSGRIRPKDTEESTFRQGRGPSFDPRRSMVRGRG
jgi:hypothetical protein